MWRRTVKQQNHRDYRRQLDDQPEYKQVIDYWHKYEGELKEAEECAEAPQDTSGAQFGIPVSLIINVPGRENRNQIGEQEEIDTEGIQIEVEAKREMHRQCSRRTGCEEERCAQ